MGGRPPANNGHNYNEAELLAPNAEDWIGFLPKLPQGCTHGAAGMIRGVIYVVTAKIRYARSLHFFKIDPRATQWTSFAAMSDDAEKNKEGYFHGTAGSKLYIFGTLTSEVYDPDDDKWTVLPELPTSRSQGATAVVEYAKDTTTYAKIFCLGGAAGRPVNTVSIFDTATNEWSDGVRMNTPRKFHAAAAYNGLVIIAGGMDDTNIKLSSVEVFDIELERWLEKSPMIAGAWADFSSGPMPVLGGKLLLPSAHQNPNGASTRPAPGLEYDIEMDSWAEGPSLARMRGQYTIVVGTRT
jgi:N-acetylneuraminic acid mutarotase